MEKSKEMIAGLESLFQRPLTEDEKTDVIVWTKCQQLDHFISGFPNEWNVIREMLDSSRQDVANQWLVLLTTHPDDIKDLAKLHAIAYASYHAYSNIIASSEGTSEQVKQVPEAIKEGLRLMQAVPR